jgi:hypothetical protein
MLRVIVHTENFEKSYMKLEKKSDMWYIIDHGFEIYDSCKDRTFVVPPHKINCIEIIEEDKDEN